MKKLLPILALLLLSLFALSACKVFEKNVSLENGLELVATSDERSYAVSSYEGTSNFVIIPSNYKVFAVTAIGGRAFKDCTNLLSVTIPNSISSIAGDAFEGCDRLVGVFYTDDFFVVLVSSFGTSDEHDVTSYYYSETAPTTAGNYWHYDKDGNIVVWGEE